MRLRLTKEKGDRSKVTRLGDRLASFFKERRGAVAAELALIGVPLVLTVFATLEVILVILVSASLSTATAAAARQIRTGHLQTGGTTTAVSFGQLVCSNMSWLSAACTNNITVNAQTFQSFGTVAAPNAIANGAINTGALQFDMGHAGDIVLVKTYVTWNLLTPMLSSVFGGLRNGQIVISGTAAFRNEPYS